MSSVSALDFDISAPAREASREYGIRATDPNGFDIIVFCDERGARVCFGGLEYDFETKEEAAEWVKRALSESYRLRIDLIEKRPYRWALEEILSEDETREVLVSGYTVSRRLLHKKRTIYRQNHRYRTQDEVSVQVH